MPHLPLRLPCRVVIAGEISDADAICNQHFCYRPTRGTMVCFVDCCVTPLVSMLILISFVPLPHCGIALSHHVVLSHPITSSHCIVSLHCLVALSYCIVRCGCLFRSMFIRQCVVLIPIDDIIAPSEDECIQHHQCQA